MADNKITQLNPLLIAASIDVFPIVSISGAETMKISFSDLMASPVPIGILTPSTARFTTLTVASGVTVNNFSNDATLSGDSSTTLPTQQAVKRYVDTQIGGLAPNKIWQDDSYVEVIDGTTSAVISFVTDSQLQLSITPDGLSLSTGVTVNHISNDTTLASDSTTALVTEYAVKTYVDTQIADLSPNIIWQDDSYVKVLDDGTNAGQITIVADGSQVASFDVNEQSVGINNRLIISDSISAVPSGYDVTLSIDENGIALQYGQSVNNISDNGTLSGDSTSTIVTEHAIKEYVDTAISDLKEYVDTAISDLNFDKIWEGDSSVEVIDTTDASVVNITIDNSLVGVFDSDGLTLSTGASINEFSTDGTLADDSDDAVPTEKAVKTYVDAAIASVIANDYEIFQGDSRVTVVDDTTDAGYIEIVVDGVQVGYYDAQATSQRLGKAPTDSGYSVVTSDSSIVAQDTSGNNIANLTQNQQTLGLSAYTNVDLNQSTNTITLTANSTSVAAYTDAIQSMGVAANEYITINQTANTIVAAIGGNNTISLGATSQTFGIAGDSRLILDQTADTAKLYAGTIEVLNASTTTQRFGVSGDTALTLNTSADTFTLSAGASTQISGTLTSLELGISGDTIIILDQFTNSISITAGGQSQILVETSGTSIYDNLTVTGDLFVDGTTFVVNQTEVRTADNVIVVNYGEPGAGVTAGTAGMQVDRGTLSDYFFVFAENTDTFRIGEESDTQAVATREDNPFEDRVPYWNDIEKRFDTQGNTYITIDQTAGSYDVGANSVEAMTIDENGIQLFTTGATINEFSTDGTLSGDSDTAVPTEKAVKAYVDSQIGDSADKIWEGDSYVEVVDDGTNAGYITIVTDGVEVAHYDAQSSTQRIGKSTESRMLVADDTITFYAGASPAVQLTLNDNGLTLASGITVNSISSGTGLGSSDTTLITQAAAKTYIDSGDSTTLIDAQAYTDSGDASTLSSAQSYADGVAATAESNANSYTDSAMADATTYIDAGDVAILSSANSYTDDEITTLTIYVNNGFTDTTSYIDTQDASTLSSANGYTDAEIAVLRNELDLINMRTVTTDTTAVTGDVVLVDTTAGDVTIEMQTGEDSRIIIKKKTTDGNKVNITTSNGTIDGQNLIIIDTPYQSFTFVSDGSNYYII